MFAKLAVRNIQRQLGSYAVYFVTIILAVAMLFSINNITTSQQLSKINSSDINFLLNGVQVISAIVTCFVMAYATSFMLKLRSKEFGLYLTMGMTRKNIITLFCAESSIISLFALVLGIILGLLLYQVSMALLCYLMEIDVTFNSYSTKGIVISVLVSVIIFFLSGLSSAWYLRKTEIKNLLKGNSRYIKRDLSALFMVLSILFLAGLCFSFYMCFSSMNSAYSDTIAGIGLIGWSALCILMIFCFQYCMSRSVFCLLAKTKKLKIKGTNLFLFRQLSQKAGVTSAMIAIISVLIFSAIVLINLSMTEKNSANKRIDMEFPFDIVYSSECGLEWSQPPLEVCEELIQKYSEIEKTYSYPVYTTAECGFGKNTEDSELDNYKDRIVKLSDINYLLEQSGYPCFELSDEYIVVDEYRFYDKSMFSDVAIADKTLHFKQITRSLPRFLHRAFFVIVPDDVIDTSWDYYTNKVYWLETKKYDAFGLDYDIQTYLDNNTERTTQFLFREANRQYNNQIGGVLAIGMMYIAIIFVIMSLAILSLNTLSSIREDKERYNILKRLGVDREGLEKTLFRQIFSFFALPFFLPALLTIPVADMCYIAMKCQGFPELLNVTIYTAAFGTIFIGCIYLLYYTITFAFAKRQIIKDTLNKSTYTNRNTK